MEDWGTIGTKLGQSALRTPVDKHITTGEDLGASLGLRQEAVRRLKCLDDRRLPSRCVDFNNFSLRERMGVDFTATTVLGSVRGVIIERDDFLITVLRHVACMMLEAELHVGSKIEIRLHTTETPDDFAGGAIDLMDGTGIPSGNEVVAFGVFVDRIDVEVIPRI
jgi:hypothetical protein